MKLSIVTTLYQSEEYIPEFYRRASEAAQLLVGDNYEIIFVNDGSPDNSLDVALKIASNDPKIIIVDLSRNFGHHKAMMTGLKYAKGEKVFLIDSDLEEEPEWLLLFDEKLRTEECDVVYGKQEARKGNWFERHSGNWFYSFFKLLTGLDLPRNIVTARLMSSRYVRSLLAHEEREVFLAGLWWITGYKQFPCHVKKHNSSETTYTLRKKMSLIVNSVTSFSNAPLIGIFYTGITISTFSISYIIYLVVNWLFFSNPLGGWTSIMASIWLLGGLIISFIGVVGIYLSKVFSETKNRPYTIVRQVYGK